MFFIDIAVPRDVDPEMGKLEGVFVYDIDDLQAVAAAHLEERSREASDAETLIAGEVERFHQKQRAVNAAPAIVALQRQAEEIRQAELRRIQSRLGALTSDQQAAVEALTRGLVNKFLHPPMQALKQAAREGDQLRLETVCDEWSIPAATEKVPEREAPSSINNSESEIAERDSVSAASVETRR
jgi:glutamyl-tRNA reductase